MRKLDEKALLHIEKAAPRFLPCPKRKDRADIAVDVCKARCPHARRCPVFQRWLQPRLDLGDLSS